MLAKMVRLHLQGLEETLGEAEVKRERHLAAQVHPQSGSRVGSGGVAQRRERQPAGAADDTDEVRQRWLRNGYPCCAIAPGCCVSGQRGPGQELCGLGQLNLASTVKPRGRKSKPTTR